MWYNSTSATLKVRSATSAGTWSTGGNLPQGFNGSAAAGTQTAALSFGGTNPVAPGPIGPTANTNSYNGTSFYGLGTTIFSIGYGVAHNFDRMNWVSVGLGTNTIA